MNIIQIFTDFSGYGGVENIILSLADYLRKHGRECLVMGETDPEKLGKKIREADIRYRKADLFSLLKIRNSILIIHSRKMSSIMVILNSLFFRNNKIVYVAHGILNDNRRTSFYPSVIVAVSEAVKKNLIDVYGIDPDSIRVINNGIPDAFPGAVQDMRIDTRNIRILMPARICREKQQVKIVRELAGSLLPAVHVDFAGDGSDVEELKSAIEEKGGENFRFLGFSENIPRLIRGYDYVLLFSENEGLGLSIIEGCMASKPVITRGTSGCAACGEVCFDKFNGFIVDTFDELRELLNSLCELPETMYENLCSNARAVYLRKFRLENMLESYLEVLDAL